MSVTAAESSENQEVRPTRRWGRSWIRWPLGLLLLILTLVYFAPLIVASTGLRHQLAAMAGESLQLRLQLKSATLGWFSPVVIRGIQVRDLGGELLAEVDTLTTSKSLLALATNPEALGVVTIDRPQVRLRLRPGGSNWEDALKPLLEQETDGATALPAGTVQVRQGQVEIHDADHPGSWAIRPLDMDVRLKQAEHPLALTLSARVPIEGQHAADQHPADQHAAGQHAAGQNAAGQRAEAFRGEAGGPVPLTPVAASPDTAQRDTGQRDTGAAPLAASLQAELLAAEDLSSGTLKLGSGNLPLGLVQPFANRLGQRLKTQGQFSGKVAVDWQQHFADVRLQLREFLVRGLSLDAPDVIGSDHLQIEQLAATGQVHLADGWCRLNNVQITSDVGTANAQGAVRVPGPAARSLEALLAELGDQPVELQADLDLARVSRLLPQTLHLQADTRITAGRARCELTSTRPQNGRELRGTLRIEGLRAVRGEEALAWQQPVALQFQVAHRDHRFVVDQLRCDASFLTLNGRGGIGGGQVQLQADLDRLHAELGQLVDLAEVRLAGQLGGELSWQVDPQRTLQLGGQLTVTALEVALPGYQTVRDDRLQVTVTAAGALDDAQRLERLDRLELICTAGSDQCSLTLPGPVTGLTATPAPSWPLVAQAGGSLDSWTRRLQPFVPLGEYRVAGTVKLHAEARVDSQQVHVGASQVELRELRCAGPGVNLHEPQVLLNLTGRYHRRASRWVGAASTLASSSLSARCDDLVIDLAGSRPAIQGHLAYRGDVARLYLITATPDQPAETVLFGKLTGTCHLNQQGDQLAFRTEDTLEQLGVARKRQAGAGVPAPQRQPAANQPATNQPDSASSPWETLWEEPRVRISGQGNYDLAQQSLQLQQLLLEGDALQVAAHGELKEMATHLLADLQGELHYDWSRIIPRLQPLVGSRVSLQGTGKRPLQLKGPLLVQLDPQGIRVETVGFRPSHGAPAAAAPTAAARTDTAPTTAAPTESSPATVRVSPELTGHFGIGWDAAQVEGLTLGPGELKTNLQSGTLTAEPVTLQVDAGRLRLQPQLNLNHDPLTATVLPGRVAEKLHITPEMCSSWLKYVAPLVADATRVEGQFSADLQHSAMPLAEPTQAQAAGVLEIHGARLGPGPLSQQLIMVVEQIEALTKGQVLGGGKLDAKELLKNPEKLLNNPLVNDPQALRPKNLLKNPQSLLGALSGGLSGAGTPAPGAPAAAGGGPAAGATPASGQTAAKSTWVAMPAQKINFQVADGRVYHRGLTMDVDGVTVQTEGSVGFDQSLALQASVPIPEKWLKDSHVRQLLQGQVVRLPVTGTVSRPKVDQRALVQLSQQLLGQAAAGAAQGEFNRALQKLIGN